MMQVGVIGSGIAGLYAAYRFSLAGARVTLFERQPAVGMGAHSFEFQGQPGDVPSRMLNRLLWPRLLELYDDLGIEVSPVDPGQTFYDASGQVYLTLDESYRPWNLLTSMLSAKSRRILSDAERLMRTGGEALDRLTQDVSFGEFLGDERYSEDFVYGFLYPTLSSTVCTCSYEALDRYPAQLVLDVLQRLTGVDVGTEPPKLLRVARGTKSVEHRLLASVDEVLTGTRVDCVQRLEDGVSIEFLGQTRKFDHVVMATQANTGLRLVSDLRSQERELLGSVEYETVHVCVHDDTSWMPAQRRNWRTFNMRVHRGQARHASCTVWMNRFHHWESASPDQFQTISDVRPEPSNGTSLRLQRPVVNRFSFANWALLDRLHRESERRLWFVGSWAYAGLPLLESGIESVSNLPLLSKAVS